MIAASLAVYLVVRVNLDVRDAERVSAVQQVLQQVYNRTWNSIVSLLVLLNSLQFCRVSS